MDGQLLSDTFVELTDTMVADFDIIDFLHVLTTRSVELLDVSAAGLLLADPRGELRVVAASSEAARLLEQLQVQLGQGPCLDCFRSGRAVTATDLAVMGATLADGGVNPVTRARVISPEACRAALTVMATAGLYETSGDWLYDTGVPGKSGIGGGIVTVAPGKGGLGTFAPPLDRAGNSVRGQLAARFLSRGLGLSLFASRPADQAGTRTSAGGRHGRD